MKAPEKNKKITVKFFLNKVVEPILNDRNKKLYPLYIQVTYNRRNMQFKSRYSIDYYESLEEAKPSLLKFEERVIKSIVTYDAAREKEQYDLKGLKKKYNIYSVSIMEALERYLMPKLQISTLNTNSELIHAINFGGKSTVRLVYELATGLFKNFDSHLSPKLKGEIDAYHYYIRLYHPVLSYNFPTLIDWEDGSYKPVLEEKVKKAYKNKPELLTAIEKLIDAAVAKKIKELKY